MEGVVDLLATVDKLSTVAFDDASVAELLEVQSALEPVTGEPLEPVYPGTAAAQARGELTGEHVRINTHTMKKIPSVVDDRTRADAETDLAAVAAVQTPEALRKAAALLLDLLDPDGPEPNDGDTVARREMLRNVTLGPQDADGMSELRAKVTPEFRAYLQPIFAKLAAKGSGPTAASNGYHHPCWTSASHGSTPCTTPKTSSTASTAAGTTVDLSKRIPTATAYGARHDTLHDPRCRGRRRHRTRSVRRCRLRLRFQIRCRQQLIEELIDFLVLIDEELGRIVDQEGALDSRGARVDRGLHPRERDHRDVDQAR